MAYYVFDLDETLGEFYTVFCFLSDLKPEEGDESPPELAAALAVAYDTFVKRIAAAEGVAAGKQPLGILRPGILDVMREAAAQKEAGLCKGCVIYSNNGHLPTLHFARDVIEEAIGAPGLFCDTVHWGAPIRAEEIVPGEPGRGEKTIKVLVDILADTGCGADRSAIELEHIMFFDDLEHPDLQSALFPYQNYIQVEGYKYKAPFTLVAAYFEEALATAGIVEGSESYALFEEHVARQYGPSVKLRKTNNVTHLNYYRAVTQGTASMMNSPPPRSISTRMMQAVQRMKTRLLLEAKLSGGSASSSARKRTTLKRSRRAQNNRKHTRINRKR